jgi:hypothetical protein
MDNAQRAASYAIRRVRALICLTPVVFEAGLSERTSQKNLAYLHQLQTTGVISRAAYELLIFEQEMALTRSRAFAGNPSPDVLTQNEPGS